MKFHYTFNFKGQRFLSCSLITEVFGDFQLGLGVYSDLATFVHLACLQSGPDYFLPSALSSAVHMAYVDPSTYNFLSDLPTYMFANLMDQSLRTDCSYFFFRI